jgi:hypothetical protein
VPADESATQFAKSFPICFNAAGEQQEQEREDGEAIAAMQARREQKEHLPARRLFRLLNANFLRLGVLTLRNFRTKRGLS